MAKEIKPRFTLKSVDDIFSTQEMRDEEKLERVREIAPEELSLFKNHSLKSRWTRKWKSYAPASRTTAS